MNENKKVIKHIEIKPHTRENKKSKVREIEKLTRLYLPISKLPELPNPLFHREFFLQLKARLQLAFCYRQLY